MGSIDKIKLRQLFSNMCCSNCKTDFDENAINIVREEEGMFVLKIICPKCQKSFGLAFLGLNTIDLKQNYTNEEMALNFLPLEPQPINYDDVLDAHKFIQNLDETWMKYIKNS